MAWFSLFDVDNLLILLRHYSIKQKSLTGENLPG
jgi:hypothetical protein